MAEHKKALKIKITMQSPRASVQRGEAQKQEPRPILLAFVGLALGLGAVLVWWEFTGQRPDGAETAAVPLDGQLTLERAGTSPSTASTSPGSADPSIASLIDEPVERLPASESVHVEPPGPQTKPVDRVAPPQTTSTPTRAIPVAEEIVASVERGSTALAEAEPQQVTHNRADVPAPQPPWEKLAAVAPLSSSNKPATTPLTNDSAHIARALFTSTVRGGEPKGAEGPVIFSRGKGSKSLYFFTELRGLEGKTVTHRWEYQGQTMLTIPFKIGSNRWRVYSNKRLPTNMTGGWRVVVADSTGAVLAAKEFHYRKR